jgi:branched-chain amino acid transport system substrate-binding protein
MTTDQPTDDANEGRRHALTRRQFVLGALGTVSAAALVAACGSDDGEEAGAGTEAPAETDAAETAAAETVAAETVAAETSAAAAETSAAATETSAAAVATGGANAAKFGGGGGDGTVKIGFTAPLTGPLAGFGAANEFILSAVTALAADGIMLGDKSYKVEIISKDVESNSDTAASRAGELIVDDGVDLMLSIATPEMINPVADQCEANGVPCLSTLAPWQPYFLGRGGDPAKGFDWTYHFFWGAEQLVGNFVDLWESVETNKKVGLFSPNDPDGNALADAKTGFPAGAAAAGYTIVDPGRYEPLTQDFSAIIGKFKEEQVDIVVGIPIPPDWANFWTAAKQQGLNLKLVTVAKACLFPEAVEALGDIGDGICTEVWWTPNHPFASSLTGEKAQELSAKYEATGKQWTQFVGFVHALFEVAFDVLGRAGSTDKKAIADAAGATDLATIVGPVKYGSGGAPRNVSPTSLVGGQWQKQDGAKFPFDLVVTNNKLSPEIPKTGELRPLA